MKKEMRYVWCTGLLFLVFALFTGLVATVDVRPIGPEGGLVGFAAVNGFVFQRLGTSDAWYRITECLGIAYFLVVAGFGTVGLYQLVKRKDLRKVDGSLLALGAFYGAVAAAYLLFEVVVINCRPVLLGEVPEASYPSSHTMLAVCVAITAALQFRALCPERKRLCRIVDIAAYLFAAVMAVGRLLSGVHWYTDIVGSLLLSAALVMFYRAAAAWMEARRT